MGRVLIKDKGETFDEFCITGVVVMVPGCCIHWFVLSVIGIICPITTGLVFNISNRIAV